MPNHDLLIAEHTDALFQAHRLGTKGLQIQTLPRKYSILPWRHFVVIHLWRTCQREGKESELSFHFNIVYGRVRLH